jgi:hypothetical protein
MPGARCEFPRVRALVLVVVACIGTLGLPAAAGAANFPAGQSADRLIGAANYTDRSAGTPLQTAAPSGMVAVDDITFDSDGSTYVVDTRMHRVMRWASPPASDNLAAEMILFKPSAANGSTSGIKWSWFQGIPEQGTNRPSGIDVAGNGATLTIALSDMHFNRVLLLKKSEGTLLDGDTGTIPLGQSGATPMASVSSGRDASNMNAPMDVWTDGVNRVAVADTANHRVLLWNTWPSGPGDPADVVLGQAGFAADRTHVCPNRASYIDGGGARACYGSTSAQSRANMSAATLANPSGVHFDGVNFYVADTSNHRVLVWTSWPGSHGADAQYVIGQPDFTSYAEGSGSAQLDYPQNITTFGSGASQRLAVSSSAANRVVVYSGWDGAKSNGPGAHAVLGQPAHDFEWRNRGGSGTGYASARTLNGPLGLEFEPVSGDLWVADRDNNRVLRYTAAAIGTAIADDARDGASVETDATRVLGQANYVDNVPLGLAGANWIPTNVYGWENGSEWSRLATAPDGKLIEANSGDHSVRIWDTAPTAVDEPYDVRWGQRQRGAAGINGPNGAIAANKLGNPSQVWTDGTKLLVVDTWNHRVLAWKTGLPTTDTQAPEYVIGQTGGFLAGGAANTTIPGNLMARLSSPRGVTSDGVDVYVVDSSNNRVLVFRNFWSTPSNGPTADLYLGGLGSGGSSLNNPWSADIHQGQLLVADRNNDRIAIWNDAHLLATSDVAMDAVIGGAGIATGAYEVSAAGNAAFWTNGSRVRVLDPIPRSGTVSTSAFVTAAAGNIHIAADGLDATKAQLPSSVSARAGKVWVTSQGWGRLMRFTDATAPTFTVAPAAAVRCDGTVTVSWTTSESTTTEIKWGNDNHSSWSDPYDNSYVDTFGGVSQYSGPTHSHELDFPTPGTYYARVRAMDWNNQAVDTQVSFTVLPSPSCVAPTSMLADDADARAPVDGGSGRANPSLVSSPPIKSSTFHTGWRNQTGVQLDSQQTQTWSTPPEHAGGLWHLDNSGAADANAANSTAVTWYGTPGYATDGRFSPAIRLNGSTQRGEVAHAANLTKVSDFTVDAWIRTTDVNVASVVVKKGDCSADCTYSIETRSDPDRINATVFANGAQRNSSIPIGNLRDGNWHHVALTVDSAFNLLLYVDGVPDIDGAVAMTGAATQNAAAVDIGSNAGFNLWFKGDVDEVRFSPRAYTAADIMGYFKTGRPHAQMLHDSGVGGGQGTAMAACADNLRCADVAYAGVADILRPGAHYWSRTRFNTTNNDYWSYWSVPDWLETQDTTDIAISTSTPSPLRLGTTQPGTDRFGTATIEVTSNSGGGYQLLANDGNTGVGMNGMPSGTIPDSHTPGNAPIAWDLGDAFGIGYSVRNATGNRLSKWGLPGPYLPTDVTNNLYTGLGASSTVLHARPFYSTATDHIELIARVNAPPATPPGDYTTTVQLTAVALP